MRFLRAIGSNFNERFGFACDANQLTIFQQ